MTRRQQQLFHLLMALSAASEKRRKALRRATLAADRIALVTAIAALALNERTARAFLRTLARPPKADRHAPRRRMSA